MRIDDAVLRMNSIRQQLTAVESRRAFRSISVVGSIGIVLLAGAVLFGDSSGPAAQAFVTAQFVSQWVSVAVVCALMMVIELVVRIQSSQSQITIGWSRRVAATMLPAMSIGALLTWAVYDQPELAAHLPALWSILYGLAIVNARHLLPPLSQCAAAWLVLAAVFFLRNPGAGGYDFTANQIMMLLFGTGQLLLAIGLFSGVKPNGRE